MINLEIKRYLKVLQKQVNLIEKRAGTIDHDKITSKAFHDLKAGLQLDEQREFLREVLQLAKPLGSESRYQVYQAAIYGFQPGPDESVKFEMLDDLGDAFRPFVRTMVRPKAFPHFAVQFAQFEELLAKAADLSPDECRAEVAKVIASVSEQVKVVSREHPDLLPNEMGW